MKAVKFKIPSETEIKLVDPVQNIENSQNKLQHQANTGVSQHSSNNTPDQNNSHNIIFPVLRENTFMHIQDSNRQFYQASYNDNKGQVESQKQAEQRLAKASKFSHKETQSSNSFVFIRKDRKSFKNYTYIQQMLNKYIGLEDKTYMGEKMKFDEKIDRIDRVKGYQIEYPLFIIPIHSKFKATWDLILLLLIVWMAVELPWEFAFPEDQLSILNNIILVFYSLDILVNLRTTYYNSEQEEIVSGYKCALNYIQSFGFVIDVISSLPYDQISELKTIIGYQRLINMLKFSKITHLVDLNQILKQLFTEKIQLYSRLFKNFFLLLLILHWFSLLYYTLASTEVNSSQILTDQPFTAEGWTPSIFLQLKTSSQRNFDCDRYSIYHTTIENKLCSLQSQQQLFNNQMDQKCTRITNFQRYIFTYYSIVMLLLGGEVAPITEHQSQTCGFIAIVGQISLAIIFANMSFLIFKIRFLSAEQDKQSMDLKFQMEQQSLPSNIQQKVFHYFNYCWRKKQVYLPDLQHFHDLSDSLRLECLICINKHLILNIPMFEFFNDFQILSLVEKLKIKVFMPNDCVFDYLEVVSDLYYVNEGVLELIQEIDPNNLNNPNIINKNTIGPKRTVSNFNQLDDNNHLNKINSLKLSEITDKEENKNKIILSEGDHFAQFAILGKWQSNYCVKSILFSIVSTLSIADFNELRDKYPELQLKIKLGMKYYKLPIVKHQIEKWCEASIFNDLNVHEIEFLMINIMEDIFGEIGNIIIKPLEYINSIYFILDGKIDVYQENIQNNSNQGQSEQQLLINYKNQDSIFFNCFDDQIEDVIDDLHKNRQNQFLYDKCTYLGSLGQGNYFGNIPNKKQLLSHNKYYFVCKQPCHFLVLTQNELKLLRRDDEELYIKIVDKLKDRIDPVDHNHFFVNIKDEEQNSLNSENDCNQNKENVSINLINNPQQQQEKGLLLQNNDQNNSLTVRQENLNLSLDDKLTNSIMNIDKQLEILRNFQTTIEILLPSTY